MDQPLQAAPGGVRKALLFSVGQRYVAFGLQLVTTIVLARLLTPAETGVFSLAAAVVGVAQVVREFGVSDYLISRPDLTRDRQRAAFTMTLLVAWTIGLLLALLAGPMARWYQEPGVAQVLHVLSINFALLPLGAVAFATMARALDFKAIFLVNVTASVVGAAVTLLLAWRGFSYMSMPYGALASTLSTIVLLLGSRARGNVFLVPTLKHMRSVFRFGGGLTGARVLEAAAVRSPDFIVSAVLGFHATGLLSKSLSLNGAFHEFFSSAFTRVATPAFAQAMRNQDDLRAAYLRGTELMALALWLFFGLLAVLAEEFILVLLGPAWIECKPVLVVFACQSMMWGPFLLAGPLLTARGAIAEQLKIQMVGAPALVIAILIGASHSLMGVALGIVVSSAVRLALTDGVLRRTERLGLEVVLAGLGKSAAVGLLGAVAAWTVKWLMIDMLAAAAWATLLAGGIAGLATALLAMRWTRHSAWGELKRLVAAVWPWHPRRDTVS